MKKIKNLAMFALIIAVLASGCIDSDSQKETVNVEVPQGWTQVAVTPVPLNSEQGKAASASWPQFALVGQVTYIEFSAMSEGPEYSITLTIQNVAQNPVAFNKIVAKYDDQIRPITVETNIYPTTLNYGEAIQPTIETYDLRGMQDNVEKAGKKTIVIHVRLNNGDEDVSGDYEASLPPLSYMEKFSDQSHQIFFAKN